MMRCSQHFLDALRNLPFGESCGETTSNVFVFFFIGLVRGVVTGVAGTGPLDVLPFLLLDCRGLEQTGWLGVCCGGIRVDASAAWPSAVMAAMITNSCLACSGIGVTLAAAAASSASTYSISSSEAGGVVIFALPSPFPLPARTGINGSSLGSFPLLLE